jgi:hypothetical protein
MGTEGTYPAVKGRVHEGYHSPSSNAEVKNEWSYTSTPPIFLQNIDRDNFVYFYSVKSHDYMP